MNFRLNSRSNSESSISQSLSRAAACALPVLGLMVILASSLSARTLPGLVDAPVTQAKLIDVRTENSYRTVGSGSYRVWVYFRDKGVFDETSYRQAAEQISQTERSKNRRAKVGIESSLFLDLPVVEDYVQTVIATGAELRRRSRWLNAISIDATSEQLIAIRALPQVASISSVVGFKGNPELVEQSSDEGIRPIDIARSTALSYGSSFAQLDQLKVPVAHNLGYTGQGVLLALFDTGFRTGHDAFTTAINEGRLIAQYDFVFNDGVVNNQPNDDATAWNHGTYIWSTSAGEKSGTIYGPAYKASVVLCKTEDVRSETPVEEDNWVAALEFVDSIGVDVVSSSLGYLDWYTYPDFNGTTATITLAANTAAALGIVVCNSMGNEGPAAGTLTAPADAFDILSVGSVTSVGNVSSFSSRGPTFDGRLKPEVVARGSATFAANAAGGTTSYSSPSGTSLSTPLVAGVACLLIEARPGFSPLQIRQALMESASNATAPDNNIGWGIVNIEKALDWGLDVAVDISSGNVPLTCNFSATSPLGPTSYLWDFGDGTTSTVSNPSHVYTTGGSYTVTCTIGTPSGGLVDTLSSVIAVQENGVRVINDSVYAGHIGTFSLQLSTPVVLDELTIPLVCDSGLAITLNSVIRTSATAAFDSVAFIVQNHGTREYVLRFVGGSGQTLPVGSYSIANLTYQIDPLELGGRSTDLTSQPVLGHELIGSGPSGSSNPAMYPGSISSRWIRRGNVDSSPDFSIDLVDLTVLVDNLFITFSPILTVQSGDCTGDLSVDLVDLTYLVAYLYLGGPDIPTP